MYTLPEIHNIRAEARSYNLSAPAVFWVRGAFELQQICNGCGPEFFPSWARELSDFVFRRYKPAVAIHDYRFECSDGTEFSRCAADMEFYQNCLIIWRRKFGWSRWLNPIALWERRKIKLAYKALYYGSNIAWGDAYMKRKEREGGNV